MDSTCKEGRVTRAERTILLCLAGILGTASLLPADELPVPTPAQMAAPIKGTPHGTGGSPVEGAPPAKGGYARNPDPATVRRLFSKAQALHMQAGVDRRKGELGPAARRLGEILDLPFPDEPAARKLLGSVALNLADLHVAEGRWDDARKAVDRGLGHLDHPGLPPTYHLAELLKLQSRVLDQLGKREEGEKALKRCLEIHKNLEAH